MQRYSDTRRPAMYAGLVAMVAGLIGASFCNTVAGLIATQGVLYGMGCILLYFPAQLFLDEWFMKRKALAYGISWSGTGLAGVIAPFVMQWLLDSYGFRSALRAWAVVLVSSVTLYLRLARAANLSQGHTRHALLVPCAASSPALGC